MPRKTKGNNLYLVKWVKLKQLSDSEREFIGTEWMANDTSGTYYIDLGDTENFEKMKRQLPELYSIMKRSLDTQEGGGADFAILPD
jgi:hypothetical protein